MDDKAWRGRGLPGWPLRVARRGAVEVGRVAMRGLAAGRVTMGGVLLFVLLSIDPEFFDRAFYRASHRKSRLIQLFPLIEFAFRGARNLRAPCADFSQIAYAESYPFTRTYPPILHFLLRGRYQPGFALPIAGLLPPPDGAAPPPAEQRTAPAQEGLMPPAAEAPPTLATLVVATDRLDVLWPLIRADLEGLRDVAHPLTPTEQLRRKMATYRPAAPSPRRGAVIRAMLKRLPPQIEHLVILPWLGISGGSEKVSQRLLQLLRQHYGADRCAILAPDVIFDLEPKRQSEYGLPIAAINDIDVTLDQFARVEILDRILIQRRPKTVHIINSTTAWLALRDRAAQYACDSALFGNVYSDIRIMEGLPVGAFWQFLPEMIDHMSGILADNRAVVTRARECFALLPDQMARHHVVPTPIVGLNGRDPLSDIRPFRDPGIRRSLWMSRIAYEKRLDVLRDVAARCPDRSFSIYGATIQGALAFDLSWIADSPNVHLYGAFNQLPDLPIESFDSYIFTTSAEGMPIALLEAAMLGLPIVAPDVGGIGEFVDQTTGWLVSSPDAVDEYVAALEEIRRSPDEAARRVAASQARLLERHSWTNFCRTIATIPGYLHGEAR